MPVTQLKAVEHDFLGPSVDGFCLSFDPMKL